MSRSSFGQPPIPQVGTAPPGTLKPTFPGPMSAPKAPPSPGMAPPPPPSSPGGPGAAPMGAPSPQAPNMAGRIAQVVGRQAPSMFRRPRY